MHRGGGFRRSHRLLPASAWARHERRRARSGRPTPVTGPPAGRPCAATVAIVFAPTPTLPGLMGSVIEPLALGTSAGKTGRSAQARGSRRRLWFILRRSLYRLHRFSVRILEDAPSHRPDTRSNDFGGIARHDGVGGNVPGDHRTATNNAAVADPDARHDHRIGADEAVLSNIGICMPNSAHIMCQYCRVKRNKRALTYVNTARIREI